MPSLRRYKRLYQRTRCVLDLNMRCPLYVSCHYHFQFSLSSIPSRTAQRPYRTVQIILRIYSSPAEVILSFDIDSSCVAFDGRKVMVSPRAALAIKTQCNTVDMSRRSPSYESRLVKYGLRGFEISLPDLCRTSIDPNVRMI